MKTLPGPAPHSAPVDERTRLFREWISAIVAKTGLTLTELARRAGLSHSTLLRAMRSDGYRINFRADTIVKLANVGGIVPPDLISGQGQRLATPEGFSEPQAAPAIDDLSDLKDGQSVWTCKTTALVAVGLMPGDRFIIDPTVTPRFRDLVLVQDYDHQAGTAETLLRVFADGFAVTPNYLVDDAPRIWLDGHNAAVMGVVIKSWRTRAG